MGEMKINLSGLHVYLGMPSHRDVHPEVYRSLMSTQYLFNQRGISFTPDVVSGGAYVELGRNLLAKRFLDSTAGLFLMVDSDVTWKAEDALHLVALATKLDVVGAAYPLRQDDVTFLVRMGRGQKVRKNEFGCITTPYLGFGIGFTCVTREVMQEMADNSKTSLVPNGGVDLVLPEIFYDGGKETERGKAAGADLEWFGEDINFFNDVYDLGHDVWLNPKIQLGHVGSKIFTASFDEQLSKFLVDQPPQQEAA